MPDPRRQTPTPGGQFNPGAAPVDGRPVLQVDAKLQPNGDALVDMTVLWTSKDYLAVRRAGVMPEDMLRDFTSSRADEEYAPGATSRFDDAEKSLRIGARMLGAVHNRGGDWEIEVEKNEQVQQVTPGNPASVIISSPQDGFTGVVRMTMPAGATDVRYDADERAVRYHLDQTFDGTGRLSTRFDAKDRLMTCIYKVYGLGTEFNSQWVAKAVLRNTGSGVIRDARVRFRLEGYAEWSLWQKFPEIVPTQTAVAVYYPVLDRSISDLRTNTPANVIVEWEYTDSDGKRQSDSEGERVVLLGRNEFIFSNLPYEQIRTTADNLQFADLHNNAPMIVAWVSRDDPVIKQFAAMANKLAGGKGASESDENTVAVLKAIYDLMRMTDITYQHPPGLMDNSVSFDPRNVQNVKFPRDVLRDKSGTCIDLAILYAASANAVGIHSYLALIPGHCFPVFRLPKSGNLIAVEATGVAGGLKFGAADFKKVFEYGLKELGDTLNGDKFYLVDCQELWTRGISNPELETLPPDILERWGIKIRWDLVDNGGGQNGGGGQAGGNNGGGGQGGGGQGGQPTDQQVAQFLVGYWQDTSDGLIVALDGQNWQLYQNNQAMDGGVYQYQGGVLAFQSNYSGQVTQFTLQLVDQNQVRITGQDGQTSTLKRVQ